LVSSLQLFPAALLDLSGATQIKGEWMGSTTLPCTYTPSEGFIQKTLTWSMERDFTTSTIFRRDDSGDHVLLSRFRERVSVPKHKPGDASLQITDLQIPDSGHYTCQIVWRSENYSLITKEVTTTVKVIKAHSCSPSTQQEALAVTNTPTQSQMGSQRTHLYLVILIAVLGGAVVFLVIFAVACARKPKH
ncbi:VSIG4 protein, partial [Odontophorus gujanensis]|nr:VSIG4 protein [Odontophorus gujanensis]